MKLFSSRIKGIDSHSRRRGIIMRSAVAATVCVLAAGLLAVHFAGATPQARAATWTQIWSDEFNGASGSQPSTSNWLYDTGHCYPGCPAGNWGTGEVESMTNSTANVFEDGSGHLVIKAINNNGSWTSGRIETQRTDFGPPAGGEMAVEASIQQPNVTNANGLGYWPAFWMLGSAFRGVYTNWPSVGEVDIMEDINGLSSEFGTLHCGTSPGGPCNETTGIGSGQHQVSGLQTSFHTYRVEIDRSVSPEQIRWYLDGTNFFTINANQVDATTWANAVDHNFFIIFDLAMGGGFPAAFGGGPTSATVSGASMLVDYVRVYTSGGSGTNPTNTPVTPPTNTPVTNPTSTPTGGCTSSFTQGVNSTGSSTATAWFKPCGWTAGYVIVHYTISGQTQQNVNMSYNSSTAQWEYNIGGINSGQTLTYSFTYQQSGLQHDTGTYTWTQGGSSPTPTPTPITCPSGSFAEGVTNSGSTSAVPWFEPCGWTAGYVIVHYIVSGQTQQNVNMSYSAPLWQYTVNGISSGQTLQYQFTYQKSGLQYDTGWYTWTHP